MKTTKFELSKSCHGMTCIQAVDCSEEQLHSLHGIITNNWMPGDESNISETKRRIWLCTGVAFLGSSIESSISFGMTFPRRNPSMCAEQRRWKSNLIGFSRHMLSGRDYHQAGKH